MRRLAEPRIIAATRNRGKIGEIASLLEGSGIEVVSALDLGLSEPPETEATCSGNARLKALHAVRHFGIPAIADDSGLSVEALGGAPGVRTADWAIASIGRGYASAMKKIHELLEERKAPQPRAAHFESCICVAWTDLETAEFVGKVHGRIVWPPRGEHGFGYDPFFEPDGQSLTFGEMTANQKNAVSHRSIALRKFARACLAF